MKKRVFSMLLAGVLACSMLTGCGGDKKPAANGSDAQGSAPAADGEGLFPAVAKEDLKVGVIHITDPAEGSGYTYTHDLGIQGMQKNLGLEDEQIIRKININDTDANAITTALEECVEEGCQIIFAT